MGKANIKEPTSLDYKRKRDNPYYWLNKASDLRGAAGAVWFSICNDKQFGISQQIGLGTGFSMHACGQVFQMLCGLSLELIYKAVCVKNGVPFPKNHNILALAKCASIEVAPSNAPLLDLYTAAIYWTGKYPVPTEDRAADFQHVSDLRWNHMTEFVQMLGSIEIRKSVNKLSWELFDDLYADARRAFNDTPD